MKPLRHALSSPTPLLLAFLVIPLLASPPDLSAQAEATTGVVRGVVQDAGGTPVPGAAVVLRQQETGLQRSLTTNASGVFLATLLPTGTYDITVSSPGFLEDVVQNDVEVRLGANVLLVLQGRAVTLDEITVTLADPLVDVSDVTSSIRLTAEQLGGLPNNGRNYLDFTLLNSGVGIVQGPDGDEITFSGQRGIFNNVTVDGADFNNPFFGEQRGGQRPAFTFNQDAIEEMVVVNQGATAEFGRSAGGFVNVITKSGSNEFEGTVHYFGQTDALSADFARGGGNPDFTQNQFGLTLGGPIVRDKAFFFVAYDQQEFEQTKQVNRSVINPTELQKLQTFFAQEYGQTLAREFGPITRSNDAKALMAKLDWRLNENNNLSLKYNFTDAEQRNGTFDVDTWGQSANGIETDKSNAINGALQSQISASTSNEFRFQFSREDRDRPYEGPLFPGTNRPFPDTGADFADGFRWGMPFFLPIVDFDDRFQVLDNLSILRGNHQIKLGAEWNRTRTKQTFIGFANGRFIFNSVDGFINYVRNGPRFVQCSDDPFGAVLATSNNGTCPANAPEIIGPLLLFLQFAPVQAGQTAEDAGTQEIVQNEVAFFVQDTWNPNPRVTVNYGLRWEAQIQPDPITPPDQVFFRPFIGTSNFPSDGTIPSDYTMFQPRFGIAWDVDGDGRQVVRASAGIYNARIPGLVLASPRSTNGSVGQTIFRASFFNGFGVTPPAYGELLNTAGITPVRPDVFVVDKDFKNPRTYAANAQYERFLGENVAGSIGYNFSYTDNLFRFVNRNDAAFGSPFSNFPNDASNGIGGLTVLESTAHSVYNGVTLGLKGDMDRFQFEANYTLSFDKSDDDNERDPFSFRYVDPTQLDREYGWSDRDQRHRFNAWFLAILPGDIRVNNIIRAASAQPVSEKCGANNQGTGERAATTFGGTSDRICPNGTILERNTLRKDNSLFTWDVRVTRPFQLGNGGQVEVIAEIFNLFNRDNFQDPAPVSPLFNFDGTIRSGLGDPFRVQLGARYAFGPAMR